MCVCELGTGVLFFIEFSGTGYDSEPSFFTEPELSPKFLEPPKLTFHTIVALAPGQPEVCPSKWAYLRE